MVTRRTIETEKSGDDVDVVNATPDFRAWGSKNFLNIRAKNCISHL
jgi:hypothetical protein